MIVTYNQSFERKRMCKYHFSLLALFTTSLLWAHPAMSAAEDITLRLEKIKVIKSEEKNGDELFFSVTEIPKTPAFGKQPFELPRHFQIPSYPTHWLSAHLQKVTDIILWKKTMKTCEPMDVLVSLVEQDNIPWDMNDLLGSFELKLRCERGQLTTEWVIPDTKNTSFTGTSKNAFSFTGAKANYQTEFKLELNAPNSKAVVNRKGESLPEEAPLETPIPVFP